MSQSLKEFMKRLAVAIVLMAVLLIPLFMQFYCKPGPPINKPFHTLGAP